jgi:protein ImuB
MGVRLACLFVPSYRSASPGGEVLLAVADAFSPLVEDAAPFVYLDITGVRSESGLAEALLARAQGFGEASVGVAGTRLASRIAARVSDGGAPILVPEGGEAQFLAPLALALLEPCPELLETLERWGLRTIGAFAALPPGELARRLGAEGAALQRAARGADERPLAPRRLPTEFCEGFASEWPLAELEPFLVETKAAVERLSNRLEACGSACRRLELLLRLDPEGSEARTVELAAPTREAKTLLGLIALELAARPPAAPITGLTLRVRPERPRLAQLGLFGAPALPPDKLAAALSRLSALLGPGRLGSPSVADSHRPGAYGLAEFDPVPASRSLRAVRCEGWAAVRALRPPVELEAVLDENSRPVSVRSLHNDGLHPVISGRARVASGPWKLEEGWWGEEAFDRDYWDVELEEGGVYRIYRDAARDRWYCDGIYD